MHGQQNIKFSIFFIWIQKPKFEIQADSRDELHNVTNNAAYQQICELSFIRF